jgi:hypothetical protein
LPADDERALNVCPVAEFARNTKDERPLLIAGIFVLSN